MPSMQKQYVNYLQEFLTFEYNKHFSLKEIQQLGVIPEEILLNIRPGMIVKCFQYKAYGKSIIGEQDQPKECP